MAYYRDLREYIQALEDKGKLVRVSQPTNKDTELHPLVRLQFRGLPEEERKAWYFDNIYDAKGKKYDIPVVIGVLGASPQVYAIGIQCEVDQIRERWQQAMRNPIQPVMVENAPVHEVVLMGENLLSRGGLGEFPIPLSTPGWDVAPYMTSPYWVTKDPESGIRNVGTYRSQIKGPGHTAVFTAKHFRGMAIHWRKAKKMGKPLEAAVIIGAPPNVGFTSVSQLPTDVDEYTIAGGLAGEPLELVKCQTVDLEVPARAEIVIEGEITTTEVEPEAPFGEASGYVGQREMGFIFNIKCITHRQDPIWQAFISQYPPSESSVIRQIACANVIPNKLAELNMPFVSQVAVHFSNGSERYMVVQMDKTETSEVWRALEALPHSFPAFAKYVIAVDRDIDPWDANMVNWAITYRAQPYRDIRVIEIPPPDVMDYSMNPPIEETQPSSARMEPEEMPYHYSCLLVDAMMKWPYPPVSLPPREFMDHAIELWQGLGLPDLKLKYPWYGYNLGYWSEENVEQAKLAVRGDYYQTGEILAKRRQKSG